jgi:cytochrome b6
MSTARISDRVRTWLDERYQITPLLEFLREKEVPVGAHPMVWYYLGGATLFLFTVQIASGLLLLLYYQPGAETAHESIRYITTKVPFGWLVRSVHCWSGHLMILSLVIHMLSTMLLKAYRPPRELTWITGFILFSLALGFGFSGYLLPWNELAFFATSVGTDTVKSVPLLGDWLLRVLRGGPDVTINTLYRFFAIHVCLLPILTVGVIAVHLLFVQRQGMAPPIHGGQAASGMRFFPNFMLRDLLLWIVCLTMLGALALLLPYGPEIPGVGWELGTRADPLVPAPPGIKPEWYFLWVYQLLKEFPPHLLGVEGPQLCLLVVAGLMTVWALVPWLDRKARRGEYSPEFTDLGVAAVLFVAFLTLKAWDLGGGGAVLPDPAVVARTCAWILIALAAAVTLLRAVVFQHRWFVFSGAEVLHAALHGLAGLPYLRAGALAAGLASLGMGVALLRRRRATPREGPP